MMDVPSSRVMGNNSLVAVYSKAYFQRVDWWETQLIPKN